MEELQVETEIQDGIQVSNEEDEFTNMQRLKQKLMSVCHASRFCGICLDLDGTDKLWSVNTEFDIAVGQQTHKKLLKDIIDYILNSESRQIMASSYLCSHCTEKSIQSYLFIYNAKQLSKIMYSCVNELHSKAANIKNELRSIGDCANSNIVIVLEQDIEMCDYIDIGKMTEIIAKETPKDELVPVNKEQRKSEDVEVAKEPVSKSFDLENVEIKNIEIENENYVLLNPENEQTIEITYLEEEIVESSKVKEEEQSPVFMKLGSSTSKKRKAKYMQKITFECPRCRVIIPTYKAWKDHYRKCKKLQIDRDNLFKCKICSDTFISKRSLNCHYKTHSMTRCKVCQFIISEEDVIEHMKLNHEDYVHLCQLCKFFSYNAEGLKAHMVKFHSGPKCALCFKKVKEQDLKHHRCKYNCLECVDNVCIHYKYLVSFRDQVINKAVKIKCVDCDYVCPRREALLGHVNREHLDHHPYTCAHCEQQFYSRATLRYHINEFHRERYVCAYCDQEFFTKTSLENHTKLCQCIERDFKCDHCTCSFGTLEELANHVKLRHEGGSLDCTLCEKKFLSSVKLQDHIFKVHSGLQIKRKRSLLDCPVCDEKFDKRMQLLQHAKLHENARFPCKECNEDFDCIKKLHAHIRIHYDDVIQCVNCKKVLTKTFFPHHMVYCTAGRPSENVFTCETCGRTYSNEVQLRFHRKAHLDKVPCPVCEKPTRPIYLKGHMKYCKPRKGKPNKSSTTKRQQKYQKGVKCDWCDHMMSRYSELEAHVNRFHLKVKPYQCNYCKKSFFGKERLKDHLVTHTSAKACYCSVCNKKLQNNACLKLHMRKHTGYTPYACEICGERFRTSSIMNTHKVKKHSERTVACPLCGAMFHLAREMRSHFKKVHWKQKGKKFDPRDVKELSPAFYHLFEDRRLPKVDGEELVISSKFNEKYD